MMLRVPCLSGTLSKHFSECANYCFTLHCIKYRWVGQLMCLLLDLFISHGIRLAKLQSHPSLATTWTGTPCTDLANIRSTMKASRPALQSNATLSVVRGLAPLHTLCCKSARKVQKKQEILQQFKRVILYLFNLKFDLIFYMSLSHFISFPQV